MLSFDHGVIATGSRLRMLPGVALIDNIVAYQQQILSADLPCVRCLFSFGVAYSLFGSHLFCGGNKFTVIAR
jgi:hypothetical protein